MSKSALWIEANELAAGRPYAERPEPNPGWHDRAAEFLFAATVTPVVNRLRDPAEALGQIVKHANRHDRALRVATDAQLAAFARGMRARLRRNGFLPDIVGECFALVRRRRHAQSVIDTTTCS